MLAYIIVAYLILQPGGWSPPNWLTFWDNKDGQDAISMPCGSDIPPREHMASSSSPQLRKLAEYEAVCKAAFAEEQMLFSATPTTADEARQLGSEMAATLKELDAFAIRPLVVLEPVAINGTILSMAATASGAYDAQLQTYFKTLQQYEVRDAMMGTWLPFPEANTPVWSETEPQDFTAAVSRIVQLQKEVFPESKASILLGSQSYPSNDTTWQKGSFKTLLPYTQGIPEGLIDSFGYQGFPWRPAANTTGYALTEAHKFLRPDYAAEAAEALGVRSIWLNTGTFARAHTASKASEVTMSPKDRGQMLSGILSQATNLQDQGFDLSINLFAEDKSMVTEGVDWSYWGAGRAAEPPNRDVFRSFVKQATVQEMPVAVYDDDRKGTGVLSGSHSQHR